MDNKITASAVVNFLQDHPDYLSDYVINEVDLETVQHWLQVKKARVENAKIKGRNSGDAKSNNGSLSKEKLRNLVKRLSRQESSSQEDVLCEVADCISTATRANGFRLYLPLRAKEESSKFSDKRIVYLPKEELQQKLGQTSQQSVTDSSKPIRRNAACHTEEETSETLEINAELKEFSLYLPMQESDDELTAVLQLYRTPAGGEFLDKDKEEAFNYMTWSSIALHYAKICHNMHRQRQLSDFLLGVVKCIFTDMESMDTLVTKIMDYAQRLVDADRASLFLIDENNYLYSRLFDVGGRKYANGRNASEMQRQFSAEIRFPMGTGIAGYVAQTGQILNIKDAYADSRFNRSVDQMTGYKSNTILCMPVFRDQNDIIGVVQMINKRNGQFSREDEESFETFAVYCGLALHHTELYEKIKRSEQKYKVALEVLSYHNSCTAEELEEISCEPIPRCMVGVDDYSFDPFSLDEMQQVKHAIYMFRDLFGEDQFDMQSLFKFTLTVKKNYRRVPYHNWTHGFSVANTMYTIIKTSDQVFDLNEKLALYIGALCHDLDHRGKNNKFMLDTQSPLANIYSTSTMEHHHFNQTVTILQQDGHNIFSNLSSEDYKDILDMIKHCILATDLAIFPENMKQLRQLVDRESFTFAERRHKRLLQAITMTASDLSASTKPWHIQEQTVEIIFKEFYDQGDEERAAGRTPIPMMDRNRPDERAASQVGFLEYICTPCYQLLHQLVPQTEPLLTQVTKNLTRWKQIDRSNKKN